MTALHVWAPQEAVEAQLTPLYTTDPTINRMGATEVEIGYSYLIINWRKESGYTGVTVEAYEGDPDEAARRVYDHLVAITDWRIALWDEDGSHIVAERPALATV